MALSKLGEAALNYAREGYYVFPVVPNGKTPLISENLKQSSIDIPQITEWWKRYPFANIGLDCGKSGLIVLDIDPRHGGDKTLKGLQILYGKFDLQTKTVKTPGGGNHYYFSAEYPPGYIVPRTGADIFDGGGIDIRAKGGYVVLPPSILPTGVYTTERSDKILQFPRKLLFTASEKDSSKTDFKETFENNERIKDGARNNTLTALAGKLRRFNLVAEEILPALVAVNLRRCETPLSVSELESIVNSIQRYAPEEEFFERLAELETIPGRFNVTDESKSISTEIFLSESEERTEWVVGEMLQKSSLNMLLGSPKSGKSTLARRLAVDVAAGISFLGQFETKQLPVLYYSIQENKGQTHEWLSRAISNIPNGKKIPLEFIFELNKKGFPAIKGLLERIKEYKYGFVVIDMFRKFSGIVKIDDYVETENICDALKDVADKTGVCILWLHHERKSGGAFEGGIGSQAIRGSVYTTIKTYKEKSLYYITTEQRDGTDLGDTGITYDKTSTLMRTVGSHLSVAINADAELKRKIREILKKNPTATFRDIKPQVTGKNDRILKAYSEVKGQMKLINPPEDNDADE